MLRSLTLSRTTEGQTAVMLALVQPRDAATQVSTSHQLLTTFAARPSDPPVSQPATRLVLQELACRPVDMVRLLHDAGASLYLRDHEGRTLLMQAAFQGDAEVVRYINEVRRSKASRKASKSLSPDGFGTPFPLCSNARVTWWRTPS